MLYIGIDNGLAGGIVAVDSNEKIQFKTVTPVVKNKKKTIFDIDTIKKYLLQLKKNEKKFGGVVCILEHAAPRPISGKRACFMTGYGFGVMEAILISLCISYVVISPSKWMKGLDLKFGVKKASIEYCTKKYPTVNWTATERCTTIHHGMTDACCLAIYGARTIKNVE